MNDLDLDRLSDLWRKEPDPAEMEELRRAALAVSSRARRGQLLDAAAALTVGGVVILLVLLNPELQTMLMGGAAILVLLLGHRRQRRLRLIEVQSLSGGTEEMLDQSVDRVQATLKRTRFSLLALPVGLVLGLLVAHVTHTSADDLSLRGLITEPSLRLAVMAGAALAVGAMAVHLWRTLRKAAAELERLTLLRDSYRQERESSSAD